MSPAHRAKLSIAAKRRWENPEYRKEMTEQLALMNQMQAKFERPPTRLENALVHFLNMAGYNPIVQHPIGLKVVDAYIPNPYELIFEADGTYWHARTAEKDIERDKYLLAQPGVKAVIHLSEQDLKPFVDLIAPGNNRIFPKRSCGSRHIWCAECSPEIAKRQRLGLENAKERWRVWGRYSKPCSTETRVKLSVALSKRNKKNWANEDYRSMMIEKMRAAHARHPGTEWRMK
ncbi:hypothetical protein LCGC14_1857950 [marine sediment metagenome]|uniref:DUF559 domain-containing protein n=1 Tax=marine sediment metagenome TaxID=412755 RepID=A0A0F9GWR4_9ZZZZ